MVAWDEMRRRGWVTKGAQGTFRDNGYIHYIDYSDRFMAVYSMPMSKLSKTVHFKDLQFNVHKLYHNKAVKEKKRNKQNLLCFLFIKEISE